MFANAVVFRHLTLAHQHRVHRGQPGSSQGFEYIPLGTPISQIVTTLKQDDFFPGKKLSDLLVSLPSVQKAVKQLALQRQLKAYDELTWIQKLFAEPPTAENTKLKPILLSDLESLYPHRKEQLYDALCDLQGRRMVTFTTEHPAQISLTALGKMAIHLLTKVDTPPEYPGQGFSATG